MYLPNGNNESLLKYFLSRSILSRKKKYSHITYMSETLIHNFFVYIKLVLVIIINTKIMIQFLNFRC